MAKVGCNALFDHIERFNGELDPQDSSWEPMSRPRRQKRRSKPKRRRQPKPLLCPDHATFDRFLAGTMQFINPQWYKAAATFELIPAWLRFIEQRGLIDAEQHAQTRQALEPIRHAIDPLWERHQKALGLSQHLQAWEKSSTRNDLIQEPLVMDDTIRHALKHDLTIDITTTGRKTGQSRRIEIWFHNLDGELYLTGLPRPCSWYANLCAHPDFTFHLKHSAQADLAARATPVLEPARRRDIIARIQNKLGRTGEDLEERVASSPLLKIELIDG